MAILVEEEKKQNNWVSIVSTIIIVILLFAGGYYVFFKNPGVVDQVVSPTLTSVSQLSQTKINPKDVVDLPAFKLLTDFSSPLSLPAAGRNNPFKPF